MENMDFDHLLSQIPDTLCIEPLYNGVENQFALYAAYTSSGFGAEEVCRLPAYEVHPEVAP